MLANQPDGSRAAGFGLVEKVGTHIKILRYSKAYALAHRLHALTMGEHLWCYRAHCMQAYTSKFPASFGSASVALKGVVLLSLPLLLIGSSRCGTPA